MPPVDVLEAIVKLTGRSLDWLLIGRMQESDRLR